VAGLGGGFALPQSWKWGGGEVLREIFYLTCYEKTLSSHEKRNNNLTLKISSTQD